MKNILFIFLILTAFSCSSNTNKTTVTDSANAIEDHPLQDTVVDTLPNGYAAPNDSIDSGNHHLDSALH
ncbi:MAG TPA: hypothetical protein VGI61_04095 [Parafilimonas sp.]